MEIKKIETGGTGGTGSVVGECRMDTKSCSEKPRKDYISVAEISFRKDAPPALVAIIKQNWTLKDETYEEKIGLSELLSILKNRPGRDTVGLVEYLIEWAEKECWEEDLANAIAAMRSHSLGFGEGTTPVHIAAKKGCFKIIEGVFSSPFFSNTSLLFCLDEQERFPLHYAAMNGNHELVDFLARKFPRTIDSQDIYGRSPLHYAVIRNNYSAAQKLLERRADANLPISVSEPHATSNSGWTPLHFAAFRGYKDLVRLLFSHAGDLDQEADDGSTPRSLAQDDTLKFLKAIQII